MAVRMGPQQRHILELIADACVPQKLEPLSKKKTVIPLSAMHLPDVFATTNDERRFLENLESRGLIEIRQRNFLYITNAGLAALDRPIQEQSHD